MTAINKTDFTAVQDVISKLTQQVASLDAQAEALSHQALQLRTESKAANDALGEVISDFNSQLFDRLDKSENLKAYSSLKIPPVFRLGNLLVNTSSGNTSVSTVPELNESLKQLTN